VEISAQGVAKPQLR